MSPLERPVGHEGREGVPDTLIQLDQRFEIHPQYLFRWEPSQEAYILLYPEGVVKFNQTAGEILTRCTGARSVGEIVAELTAVFTDADAEADIARSVCAFLEGANAKGWIRSTA